ncbi:hypothetical protein HOP50_15g74320 [Chloropicon primus]|uniref:C3H1-type domain-containing protein n=1 Tax=Chloropicon primus TaxID=1764295 RepID=A0A5B8MWG4_9CHLO|nr:hypothetical protein A3770_15p74070 [Chloropicon primus]UPR04099.1 hypothetical protein HOP50_15g74320 [Chloropicon primus]|eukprot:QDZ24889.1 hypothetical protein A3770_15p74070 [Chloropicon primus]
MWTREDDEMTKNKTAAVSTGGNGSEQPGGGHQAWTGRPSQNSEKRYLGQGAAAPVRDGSQSGQAVGEGLFFGRTWSAGGSGGLMTAFDGRDLGATGSVSWSATLGQGTASSARAFSSPSSMADLGGGNVAGADDLLQRSIRGGQLRAQEMGKWGKNGGPVTQPAENLAMPGPVARTQSEILLPRTAVQQNTSKVVPTASLSALDLNGSPIVTSPRSPRQRQRSSSSSTTNSNSSGLKTCPVVPSGKGGTVKVNSNSNVSMHSLYKTELCRSWEETGSCRYGGKCQFAHGKSELRPIARHPKYKTEICRTFATNGTCPYGTRCRFIHYVSSKDVQQPQAKSKRAGASKQAPEQQPANAPEKPAAKAPGNNQSYDTWSALLLDDSKRAAAAKVKRTVSAFPRLEQPQPGTSQRAEPVRTKSQRLPIFESLSDVGLSSLRFDDDDDEEEAGLGSTTKTT